MQSATLNSRLRVLVAKTYRAEKLYSSIRSPHRSGHSDSLSGSSSGPASLAELANDARAKEWQSCHYALRVALNEMLSATHAKEHAKQVLKLREEFSVKTEESLAIVERGSKALAEMGKREEFAHAFKLSLDLVRQKARAQACKVIADELNNILVQSSRSTDAATLVAEITAEVEGTPGHVLLEKAEERLDNVVALPLRRLAGGSRRLR